MKRLLIGFVLGMIVSSYYPDIGPDLVQAARDRFVETGLKDRIINKLEEI
tara:strand:- start:34 stop:183 length:150 start_codon:yes stop_codon:yes gene_type:complete